MANLDRGLKFFEESMGSYIRETQVPFDIDRPLTEQELEQTIFYCKHDVEETMKVFMQRKSDFEAYMGLVKIACQGKALDFKSTTLIISAKP